MKNILHPLIRFFIKSTSYIFFEKIEISGIENLPQDYPIILACNHPNSFLDSIVLTTCISRSIHYTARGDFFKSGIASRFLRYIQILPVFRKEEGKESLHKNDETFSYCMDVFKKNGAVVIFSEGRSENEWDLRPLRKGTARLANEAWSSPAIGNKLKVVPVLIHYSSWLKVCPRVYVQFLENIEKSSFNDTDGKGFFYTKFNEKLKSTLSDKCIVVDKNSEAELQNKTIGFILKNCKHGTMHAKKMQDKYLKNSDQIFIENYKALSQFLLKEKITYYKESAVGIISFLFSAISYVVAYIVNVLPYIMAKFIVRRITKDYSFYDSLMYCVLWFVYILYLTSMFCVIVNWANILAGISFVVIAVITASIYETSKRNIQCFLKKKKLKTIQEMLNSLFETSNG